MEDEIEVKSQIMDDIPLIIEMTKQMKLDALIEKFFPTHGLQQGINNGKMTIGWLAFILSQGNHCKNAVREWSNKTSYVLEPLLGEKIREVDFSDDRLANLLDRFSDDTSWHAFEEAFSKDVIEIYDLAVEVVRCDGSAACGYHEVVENGLMQRGLSKDHRPDLPQLKIMAASLDPGLILGLDVFSGQQNDDRLYTPLIKRVRSMINKSGVLFVGDCKMSSIGVRGNIEQQKDHYLAPLELGNEKRRLYLKELVRAAIEGSQQVELIYKNDENNDKSELIVTGYETTREQEWKEEGIKWTERVFVHRSIEYAKSEIKFFNKKLDKAELALRKLTPEPIKGSRQFYDESKLQRAIEKIIVADKMSAFFKIELSKSPYNEKERFVVKVIRNEEEIEKQKAMCGWRLMVTNAPREQLSFQQAICTYRQEWTLERCFKILKKSHLGISPLYIRKDARLKGLVRLLSVAVRFIVLLEYLIAKNLKEDEESIMGLDIAHPNKKTKTPTAYSILKKFCREKIIISKIRIQDKVYWKIPSLDPILAKILQYLNISIEAYQINSYQAWNNGQT